MEEDAVDGEWAESVRDLRLRRTSAGWVSSRPRAERARQVADVLRQQLTTGRFADGVLPDERRLAAQLAASRNAVREALELLQREGLIVRRRGLGTRVVMPKYGHGLDRLAGLAETLIGYGPVTNEVRVAEMLTEPPPAIVERLQLMPGEGVVRLERLRRLDGGAAVAGYHVPGGRRWARGVGW